MTSATRTRYFALWTRAAQANGWSAKDDARRREAVLECMTLVRGPQVTTSDPAFGPDEITALFCYLDHLAHSADLDRSARWVDCQQDYRAFNRARQADWHEEQAYGARGSGKLCRDRFSGQQKAAGEALDAFDPAAIQKRFLTMRTRHERRTGWQGKKGHGSSGQILASTSPAIPAPVPAVAKAEDDGNPF